MTITFSDLVTLYRKVDFTESAQAECCIENDATLSLINNLALGDNSVATRVEVLEGELKVGETVKLQIRQPELTLGWLYDDVDRFMKGDFVRSLPNDKADSKPYYIKDIGYYSQDVDTPEIIAAYNAVRGLLIHLESMSSYLDHSKRKIIFVTKRTFELHYDVSKNLDAFKVALENLTKNLEHNLKVIGEFCIWLSIDDAGTHANEKKSILASVLSDIQTGSQPLEIHAIIENIDRVYRAAQGQFDNYLEDFKYEKFVKKLEENSERFISRVNDSISKVLSQILALPIAAAAPVILKGSNSDNQLIVYVALLVYAIICSFALSTQKAVLDNLSSEVEGFESEGKLPQSLKDRWVIERGKIYDLIEKQTHLYWVMIAVVYLAVVYSLYNISSTMTVFWSAMLFILVAILGVAIYRKIKPKVQNPI